MNCRDRLALQTLSRVGVYLASEGIDHRQPSMEGVQQLAVHPEEP